MGFDSPLGNNEKNVNMTKRNDIISIFFLLAAGLLTGCSHSYDLELRNEIAVNTGVTGLQKKVRSIDNNTALQDDTLMIDAYFHDTEEKFLDAARLVYNSSSWKFWSDGVPGEQLHYYWPIEGSVYTPGVGDPIVVSSLDFVGYCPYNKPAYISEGPTYNQSTGVTFTCDLSSYMTNTAQATVSEFMLDTAYNRTSAGGAVPLSFKHPFARVRFQLSASHPDIKINSITFERLKSGGTCTFDNSGFTWTSLTPAGTVNYVMTLTGTDAEFNDNPASPLRQIGDDWIVVPQTFAGEIEVNATWIDWGEEFAHNVSTTISSQTWQAGYSYTYTFTIRETDLRVNVEKYTEQW